MFYRFVCLQRRVGIFRFCTYVHLAVLFWWRNGQDADHQRMSILFTVVTSGNYALLK